jgi:hypothetical protein
MLTETSAVDRGLLLIDVNGLSMKLASQGDGDGSAGNHGRGLEGSYGADNDHDKG